MIDIRVGQEISGLGWSGIVTSIEHELGSVNIKIHDTMVPKKPTASAVIDTEVASVSEFPKVLMVGDMYYQAPDNWVKRVVFFERNGIYYTVACIDDLDDTRDLTGYTIKGWCYAKELEPEPKFMELTIDEIAERFGLQADQIKIVK